MSVPRNESEKIVPGNQDEKIPYLGYDERSYPSQFLVESPSAVASFFASERCICVIHKNLIGWVEMGMGRGSLLSVGHCQPWHRKDGP